MTTIDSTCEVFFVSEEGERVAVPYVSVDYPKEHVDIKKRPIATIRVVNENNEWTNTLDPGATIEILRNGDLDFRGIVEPATSVKSVGGLATLTVKAKAEAWVRLEGKLCDDYDFDEDDSGLADAIVNPWEWRILRNHRAPVTAVGQRPAITGWRPDQVAQMLIGTRCLHQNFFIDSQFFLPSSIGTATSHLNIWRDGQQSQQRQHLQLTFSGNDTYQTSGNVESIPIMNGDPNLSPMGTVSNVSVVLYGTRDTAANDPTIEVCRNATEGTRTYTTLTLDAFTAGTGDDFDKWEYSGDLSADGATTKNELAYKISLTGDGTETTSILYFSLEATTVSDTGVTDGFIQQYNDQSGQDAGNDLDDGRNFVELSLSGKRRIDALADIQGMTVSQLSLNKSPHWDIFLSPALEMSFEERRGDDLEVRYSLAGDDGRLTLLEKESKGTEIYYQVYALGAGSGIARSRFVSKQNFEDGGLYFPDLDPDVGNKRGIVAKEGVYDDSNIKDATTLLRRARAFAKLHSEPIVTYKIEVVPDVEDMFDVGDTILVVDNDTEEEARVRVIGLERVFTQKGLEKWKVELGQPALNIATTVSGLQGQILATNIVKQPNQSLFSGNSVLLHLTNNEPGILTFYVNDPKPGERWLLSAETVPWQITSRGAASGGGATSQAGASTFTFVSTDTPTIASINPGSADSTTSTVPTGDGAGMFAIVEIDVDKTPEVTEAKVGLLAKLSKGGEPTIDIGNFKVFSYDVLNRVSFTIPQNYEGGSLQINVANDSISVTDFNISIDYYKIGTHTHTIDPHTHNPNHGIWQFDGDSGNGTAAPQFGTEVEIWVDPDNLDATTGAPTGSSRGKLPLTYGNTTGGRAIEGFDVTPFMLKDADGVLVEGRHEIRLLSNETANNNTSGVAAVRVAVERKTFDE